MIRVFKYLTAIAVGAVLLFGLLTPPLPDPVFAPDYSTMVLDRHGQILRTYLAKDEQWRLPLSRDGLPPKLEHSILAFEDQRFYWHPGVDPIAVARAVVGRAMGTSRSGASTLSMQVARLAVPKERSLWNKLVECKHALQLEWRYSKSEILRMWLAQAPYGGNLVGAEAAARRYFGVDPWQLSWGQAAFLAALPKSPNLVFSAKGRAILKKRRDGLIDKLETLALIDKTENLLAQTETMAAFDYDYPFVAPHASNFAVKRSRADDAQRQFIVKTTLDRALQEKAAQVAVNHRRLLRQISVNNLAALIVHNQTAEVHAYLGSQSFHARSEHGQVDGVQAARSSGSILKPFLYALAMERRLMSKETILPDVPTHFAAFTPTNHDNRFSGEVSVADALIESKNVPAVRVLAELGVHDFQGFLQKAQFKTLFRRADEYGLALVLGGCEVRLWDLASAYKALAQDGSFQEIKILQDTQLSQVDRLLSPGVSTAVLEILQDLRRPGSEYFWRVFENQQQIAWKTGTSYGHRDAWAVGVNQDWTIAVWAGNFDGRGEKQLWGTTAAAPLMFDLFSLVPRQGEMTKGFRLDDTNSSEVHLCVDSGLRASDACPQHRSTRIPRHEIPLPQCSLHQRYFIEVGEAVCSKCWQGRQKEEIRLTRPAEVNAWLRRHGQLPEEPPLHRASCPSVHSQKQLHIVQPGDDAVLLIPRINEKERGAVVLRAVHQRQEAHLFWYLDGALVAQTELRHQHAAVLSPGRHELRVVDENGFYQVKKFRARWSQ